MRNRVEARKQERRIAKLRGERKKLLDAHYEGAIPLDLLKSEQDRITTETAEAEARLATTGLKFQMIEDSSRRTLYILGNCEEAYRKAPGKIRRQFNQSFFKKILVEDDHLAGAELTAPFAQFLGVKPGKTFLRESKNPALIFLPGVPIRTIWWTRGDSNS